MLYASGGVGAGKTVVYIGAGLTSLCCGWSLYQWNFDATKRAKQIVLDMRIIYPEERQGMDKCWVLLPRPMWQRW